MLANIPATQTVIEITGPGGPEMLPPATRPVPEPKAGEVLIRIAAGGVNRVSIGAQSFDKAALKTLERWHDPDSVPRAIEACLWQGSVE